MNRVKIFSVLLGMLPATLLLAEEVVAGNFEELLAAVKSCSDVALVKSRVYEVSETIFLQRDGQKIYTKDPKRISEYAILRISNPECGQIPKAIYFIGENNFGREQVYASSVWRQGWRNGFVRW